MYSIIFALCYVILSPPEVSARGRLMEPTQRSSLWTRGFDSPINDDDTGLNCGGRWAQHGINNGKCGVCGDRYDVTPRENEPGGKYANGIIANTYTTDDQSILVVVDIQSALGGYFEFRICPHNNPLTSVSQECLDRHQLRVWDVINKEPKYLYTPKSIGLHRLRVEIPPGMTCTQCVLQWKWHTAKDWGRCPDGNARLGCGPQEEFFNCADISIEQASASNQRLTLPEVTLTNSNQPMSFEMSQPSFDRQNVFSNIPMSFLPQEIFKAGNLGPVIPPKFDFFDPSSASTHAPTTTAPEATTVAKETIKVQDSLNNNYNVVELKFNDNTGVSTDNSNLQQTSTSDSGVTYQSAGGVSDANVDITVSSLVPNVMSSTEPRPTDSTIVNIVTEQSQVIPSSSVASQTSTSNQPMTSTSGSTTMDASTVDLSNIPAGGIAIPSFAFGDLDTGGMPVKVGMGANESQPTEGTPIVSSQATIPQESTVGFDQSSVTSAQSSTTTTTTEAERLAPVPTLLRSMRRPAASVTVDLPTVGLNRKRRQAGPPPPPPPPGASANPPPGPTGPAAPGPAPPGAAATGPAAPGPAPGVQPGPDYAPKPEQQSSRTISFGGLIGDSFSRGGTQTQHTFMTQQDFQQSMGGGGAPMPGEALSEMAMTGAQSGPVDMQGYPPDMMLAPGPSQGGAGPFGAGGGPLSEMYLDPSMAAGGSFLDAPVDANPASFLQPGIPRPPKQSSAELEAAIVGAPVLTSAVSDTQISTNAADLVGASYIPELSEGRSNQAETSTAARHGTMIVPPVEQARRTGGRNVEYLAGSKGFSMRETAADTQAEIRSATMSLARFGYQPTAEQVLSGNIGIHHPTENLDTTNLEPIGNAPNEVAGAAAPGILSAILGGQRTQVTDASLDPAVQKTREDLIRQLGEAMGVIGTSKSGNKPGASKRGQVTSLISGPSEQQQIVNTANTQQVVNAQTGVMGIGLDTGMFGSSMMDMGTGNQNQVAGAGGMDMYQGLGLQGMNMQGMDLQSLFGAADAAVNSPTMPQTAAQQKTSNQASQKTPNTAAKTRQPQSALDFVDIGMPGMTIEEMMTLLNMEQQGGATAASSATPQNAPSSSKATSSKGVGIDMESAMMGGTTSKASPSSVSKTGSSTRSAAGIESMMFDQAGTNSINDKPKSVQDKFRGLTAQSLTEMSTSRLEALLLEAQGGGPTKEVITNNTPVQPTAAPSTTTTLTSAWDASSPLRADALLTAPLDSLTTAELEALLANTPPTQPPTTTTVPPPTTSNLGYAGGLPTTDSRETTRIKAALRQAVFEATGTEFDFSQMTQAEMNDMVQMFGGLQNLQQYMTPDFYGPEPIVQEPFMNIAPTPVPVQEAPVVQTQAPAFDVPTGNFATPLDTTNVDFATMQQFLNPSMFGPNLDFGQQTPVPGSPGYNQAEADLSAMMNALNPTGAQLNTVDTISLADLLSGNINAGQSTQTQVQSSQLTDAQPSASTAQGPVSDFGQFGIGSEFGWASGLTASAGSEATGTGTGSTTSQNEVIGSENMIWDPVQMQWIAPNGSVIKDSTTATQLTSTDLQPSISNQVANNKQPQDTLANEVSSSSSSSSTGLFMTDSLLAIEAAMAGAGSTDSSAQGIAVGSSPTTVQNATSTDVFPIVGGVDRPSTSVATTEITSSSASTASSVDTQGKGIAQSNLSDLIPVGEQISAQMTEKVSPSTVNVDPSPSASTAGSKSVQAGIQTTSSSIVDYPRPPAGGHTQRELILLNHELQKKRELEMLLQKQREELRRLEEQRIEQRRKMMAEKQRIEYEKQQLALRKQQMELDALRQDQLRQRQMMDQQRKQLQEERMRIDRQRVQEIEIAKQKAIEEEKRRIRDEQNRLRELEMAKQQAAEMERQRIEAERRKKAHSELARRRAAEQERLRIEEERRRLEEERMRQEAAAAAAARAKAEAEAAAAAAAAARAEMEARERAAASMVIGHDAGIVAADTAISTNASSGNASDSFTPIGAVGGQLTDADAATAMAWQAVVKAAQIQAAGGSADPNAMITQQQDQLMQQQKLMSMLQSSQGVNAHWMKMLEQATGQATTPAPPTGAAAGGLDTAALMKLLQEQAQAQATTTPAPTTTTPKPKRKAPIRPDPKTRDFVRNMFIDNMTPGVDPLSILIGLTPEMLMKSGVNPLIANSGDLARIVPAVERALGISLKKIPVPTGPRGRPLAPQPTGFQMLNVRGGPGGGSPGSQRRDFLLQQRMMTEMMSMMGMGPEPLEPGDPGYTGPGAQGARGGAAGARGARGGAAEMGGPMAGGMGRGLGGAGGPGGGLSAQMEMLGL